MKRKLLLFCLLAFCIGNANVFGQERYLDEVFAEVTVEENIPFGENVTILPALVGGFPSIDPLVMDIYHPEGDTVSDRPIAMYLHTGSFIPAVANGSITGSKGDYTVVETCTRLAKMGYVAVAISYRQGWNPTASTESNWRTRSLLQAAYRGIQDLKTCIRYFHKTVAEEDNPYRVNADQIAVLGQGTGGYIALGAAALDKVSELELPDLLDPQALPYVDPMVFGNVDGTGYPNPMDTTYSSDILGTDIGISIPFNIPNHVEYPSDFQLAYNFGGALASTDWIDENSVPMISAHVPEDPFAPFQENGNVIVPITGEFVITVDGPAGFIPAANAAGANDVLNNRVFGDAYTEAAESAAVKIVEDNIVPDADYTHLFPLIRPDDGIDEAGPWDFTDPAFWSCEQNPGLPDFLCAQFGCDDPETQGYCDLYPGMLDNNPDMSKAKADAYIDTLIGFFAPRSVVALGLEGEEQFWMTGLEDIAPENMLVAPNPATDVVNINLADNQIHSIRLFDLAGKLVKEVRAVNATQYQLHREDISNGLYIIQIRDKEGKIGVEKILLK